MGADGPPPERSEATVDRLLAEGVLVEDPDGTLATSEAYDAERLVYHDTYGDASEEVFHETLASLFELSVSEARTQAERLDITRASLVAFMSLRGYYRRRESSKPPLEQLLAMAELIVGITPTSPVPDAMPELTDEEYQLFVTSHQEAVIFVWRLHCSPCEEMKASMNEILARIPADVAVAGVNGTAVSEFRRDFDVDAAPAVVTFAEGSAVDVVTGAQDPSEVATLCATAYDQ